MSLTKEEQIEWQKQAYGWTEEEMLEAAKLHVTTSFYQMGLSILSDAQEQIRCGHLEDARQSINRAKFFYSQQQAEFEKVVMGDKTYKEAIDEFLVDPLRLHYEREELAKDETPIEYIKWEIDNHYDGGRVTITPQIAKILNDLLEPYQVKLIPLDEFGEAGE